ncbi:2-carboxy-D-arabinitol-1-phosphatase [Lacrimispora sp.]|uniref:2-carboxy-D-arabinitol-1-phosphatase n=1 Tax=Lacrimispora sp. TaxID=2719234 RepID=UPI0034606EB1
MMIKKTRKAFAIFGAVSLFCILVLSGCNAKTVQSTSAAQGSSDDTTAESTLTGESGNESDGTVNLYLVRHGKTIMNTLGLVQGWSDSPLTEEGIDAARNAAEGLADTKFDFAYSSDRGRAIETAEIILKASKQSSDLQLITLPGLRETNFGGFEGETSQYMYGKIAELHGVKTIAEVRDIVGSENVFSDVPTVDPTQTAETHEEVVKRLVESFNTIANDVSAKGGGNVLVVGHGASLLTSIGTLTNAEDLPLGLENASVSKLVYKDGVYELEYVNNTDFLKQGAAIRAEKELPVTMHLVRHGSTDFNDIKRIEGWIDSPLSKTGYSEAEELGRQLAGISFSNVYTSGMGRTNETARIILSENNQAADIKLQNLSGLRDINYGSYEGRMESDVLTEAGDYFKKADSSTEDILSYISQTDSLGTAENIFEFSARVNQAFYELAEQTSKNGGGEILIVSSDNTIRAILDNLPVETPLDSIRENKVITITYQNSQYTVN